MVRASSILAPLLLAPAFVLAADYSTSTTQTTTTNSTSSYTTNSAATGVTGTYNTSNAFASGGATGASASRSGLATTGAELSRAPDRDRDRDWGRDRDGRFGHRGRDRDLRPYTETTHGLAPVGDGIYAGRTVTRQGYESSSAYSGYHHRGDRGSRSVGRGSNVSYGSRVNWRR